jgi:arylsulfatase A
MLRFLIALGAILVCTGSPAAADRPNVVVILCDDLGYGDLGCFGHPHIKTPNLDRLAKSGLRLTDCYSAAPVCSSSRAGLLTGRTPNRAGVYDWIPAGHVVHLRQEEVTIPSLLKDAGYDTAHVGKWHCNGKFNSPEQPQPGDHGFSHWFATQNNAAPRHENPTNFVRNGEQVGPLEGFSCQLVADEGIRWISSGRDKNKPFFLFVCFHEPHEPVESPDDLVAKYRDVAENDDQAQYFANVENMDAAVGRLVAELDEQGVRDNTLIYFSSDNGPETLHRYPNAKRCYGSPGPLRGMKLHIYEGGIRVPGIVSWPAAIEPGQVSATPVCSLDLLPTVCELAGVPTPADRKLDGESIAGFLQGQTFERSQPLFWHYYRAISDPRVAMRDGDWKLVARWDAPTLTEAPKLYGNNVYPEIVDVIKTANLKKYELYNLREDPGETRDLFNTTDPGIGAHRDRLWTALLAKYLEVQRDSPRWPEPAPKSN